MTGTSRHIPATMELRKQIQDLGIGDPVAYIERPGHGDPPRWHFTDGFVARGGAEALAYLRGMVAGIKSMEGFLGDYY